MSPNPNEETTSGAPSPLPEARATLGPYRVIKLLGRGAMGVVYEGEDAAGQRIALKVLPNWVAGEGESLKRFLREAQAASRVKHPNVVAIREAGQDGDVWFLALELVPGGSLHERMRLDGPLPWREATRALAQACRGLAAVHAAGVVHRDIKPGNILLAADGSAKVADFGLARMSSAQFSPLTVEGTTLGTPAYMSPEQCKLQKPDEFSDIYSMGATYYALLTGGPPYEGETAMQVMFAHCSLEPPDPRARVPGLPEGCTVLIRKAMARRPTDRYPSANAMADALDELIKLPHEDTLSDFPTLRLGPVPTRRRWLVTAAAATGGALVAGGAVGLAWYLSRPRPEPPPNPGPKPLSFLDQLLRGGEMKLDSPTYGFTFLPPHWLAVCLTGAGGKGGVQLWDLTTGKMHQHLWPTTGMNCLALSSDGQRVAAAGNDGTGNLVRDLPSGADIPLIAPDKRPAYTLQFMSSDRLVGGLAPLPKQKAGVRVWEVDGKVSWDTERLHEDEVFAAVSPDGQLVASTSKADRFFCVWSLVTRERVRMVLLPRAGTALAWSPDGSTLAVIATDTILFYKASGWEKVGPTIEHPGAQFWRVAFAPDGRRIVTVGVAARIWDCQTGKLVKQLHPNDWLDHRLALTSDGRVLVTGGVERPRLRFFSVAEWCAGGG